MTASDSPPELFKLLNRWTPSSSLLFLTFSFNPTSLFTSDLKGPCHLCPVGWTPEESLLHLVLCCWLHLPTGKAPTHARFCPSAIYSDFVQLVNLASPPCWELRLRRGKRVGEWGGDDRGRKGGAAVLRNEKGNKKSVLFSLFLNHFVLLKQRSGEIGWFRWSCT